MQQQSVGALVAGLKRCSRSKDLSTGLELHSEASTAGLLQNTVVATGLISMYSKCGNMSRARDVFDRLRSRDIICWNALITGYVQNHQSTVALQLFGSLPRSESENPDATTYLVAISACTSLAASGNCEAWVQRGEEIFAQAVERRACSVLLRGALLGLYCRCRRLAFARRVFNAMPERSVVVWTSLVHGYVENGESEVALQLFEECISSSTSVSPDSRLFVVALSACSALASSSESKQHNMLEKGSSIHSQAELFGCVNLYVENTLIDFYSKCGRLELAAARRSATESL